MVIRDNIPILRILLSCSNDEEYRGLFTLPEKHAKHTKKNGGNYSQRTVIRPVPFHNATSPMLQLAAMNRTRRNKSLEDKQNYFFPKKS